MDGRNVSPEMFFRNHHWREILGRPHKIPAAVIVVPGRPRIKKKNQNKPADTHTNTQESFKSATGAWDYKLDALDTTYWHVNLCLSPPRVFRDGDRSRNHLDDDDCAPARTHLFHKLGKSWRCHSDADLYTHSDTHTSADPVARIFISFVSHISRDFHFSIKKMIRNRLGVILPILNLGE